jgi:hypothetical protein
MAVGFIGAAILSWPAPERERPSLSQPALAVRAPEAALQAPAPNAPAAAATAAPANRSALPRLAQQTESAPAPQAADTAPELPVRVSTVDAPDPDSDNPLVIVRVISDSDDTLPLDVFVTTSAGVAKTHVEIVLGPHQTKQLAQDLGVALGDVITVRNPGFSDLTHQA